MLYLKIILIDYLNHNWFSIIPIPIIFPLFLIIKYLQFLLIYSCNNISTLQTSPIFKNYLLYIKSIVELIDFKFVSIKKLYPLDIIGILSILSIIFILAFILLNGFYILFEIKSPIVILL
jgi:hypothetical protein